MSLPCEHLHLVPQYPFVTSIFDNTKIMNIMSLPSRCKWAISVIFDSRLIHTVAAKAISVNTRMHSSRVRTVRSSSCLLVGRCLPQCMLRYTPSPRSGPGPPLGLDLGTLPRPGPRHHPPPAGQTPRPWTWDTLPSGQNSWHTLVKTLPFRNTNCCWNVNTSTSGHDT